MTPDELVEKVMRAMWEADGAEFKDLWADDLRAYEDQARAAIAVVLEEAAKVADEENGDIGEWPDSYLVGWKFCAEEIAIAIRAMMKGDKNE